MSANPIPAQSIDRAHVPKPGMSRTQKLLFFVTAWLICLMPFLFWWNTWFGRKLSDQQLTEYLHDEAEAHSAGARTGRRAHHAPRTGRATMVPRLSPPVG